jgi:hypothetical protein
MTEFIVGCGAYAAGIATGIFRAQIADGMAWLDQWIRTKLRERAARKAAKEKAAKP